MHEEGTTSYCSYYIYATNGTNKRANIGIEYKLSDKAAAQKIADIILANLSFEEETRRPTGPVRGN